MAVQDLARGVPAPESPAGDVDQRSVPPSSRRGYLGRIARGAVLVAVFLVHFRPWQPGLLEEWGIAHSWQQQGWAAYTARLPVFAGRPLHLLPHYVGLAVWDRGFGGEFAVLGLVAAGQVALAAWSLRPVVPSAALRWGVAAILGLHPWWPAGDILRFLPAQVATLLFVLWLGAAVRLLDSAKRRYLVVSAVALLAGFLTYQILAVTAVVAALALVLVLRRGTRTSTELVAVTVLVVVLDTWYTLWLTPRIWPASYENGIRSRLSPLAALRSIAGTVHHDGPLAVSLGVTGLVIVALCLARVIGVRSTALLVAAVVVAPATALSLAGTSPQLHDPDRVALPVGMTLWIVWALLVAVCVGATRARYPAAAGVAVMLAVGAVFAAVGYVHWSSLASDQRAVLDAVERVRTSHPGAGSLIVADYTGTYGDVYTLLPPYLDEALQVEQPGAAQATLCTPAGVQKRQPDAQRIPIPTTPDCASVPGYLGATTVGTTQVPAGRLVILSAGG